MQLFGNFKPYNLTIDNGDRKNNLIRIFLFVDCYNKKKEQSEFNFRDTKYSKKNTRLKFTSKRMLNLYQSLPSEKG